MDTHRRLLLVVTQSDLGGAQRYVLTVARAAAASGWQVTVAAGPDPSTRLGAGGLAAACADAGIAFRTVASLRREIRPGSDLAAIRELRRLIRELRPDIVHANSSKAGFLTPLALVGLRPRPRHVFTAHGWVFLEPGRSGLLYRCLERLADRGRDATVVLSPQERDAARRAGIGARGLHVVPLGVVPASHDRAAARAALSAAGIPADAVVLGCVANAYPAKNLPALIAAFTRLHDAAAHLVLVGGGTERLPGGARIHLLGPRADARALMDGFDVFVLPSVKEGLPMTLLEAMDAGLPCLATSVGGVPSVIADGMNGWLTAPDRLEDGLRRVFAARETWPRAGKAASDTVRTLFTEERMTRDTLALYRSLTESG
ncbi:glycosyltransferase family 1 protein [Patescibacteria group bacterium]|nr:MAG: glycosyltransferase family 1 protein [Patescibacteria group bacterium]